MMRRVFNIILIIGIFFVAATPAALAATINTNIPGTAPYVNNPGGWVANFYQFALLLGGLLAFGAIVYGGITYTLSAGNPEKQSDAKSRITQALLGLFLLLAAYTVLNLLNPKLTNLQIDTYGLTAACSGTTCENPVALDKASMNAAMSLDSYIAERGEQVREEASTLDQEAQDLRAEASSATNLTNKERMELNSKANELESQAELMRREELVHEYSFKTAAAERDSDSQEIKRLKGMLDASLDQGIRVLNEKNDFAGAKNLELQKFTHDIYFDAQAVAATLTNTIGTAASQKMAQDTIRDIGKKVRDEAKRLGNDPANPNVSEVFRWGAAAVDKVRDACTAKNIKC